MWDVLGEGDYSNDYTKKFDLEEPMFENNVFLCDKHGEEFEKKG